ncbi:MAG: hypothetical protein H6713_37600 [Myxococcales bacterium]|nr:hypothetical protein [Myxococcales bacterium]
MDIGPQFPYTIVTQRACWLRLERDPLPRAELAAALTRAGWIKREYDYAGSAWHPSDDDARRFAALVRDATDGRAPVPRDFFARWCPVWTEEMPRAVILTRELLCNFVHVPDAAWLAPADARARLEEHLGTVRALVEVLQRRGPTQQRAAPTWPWRALAPSEWRATRTFTRTSPRWSGWLGFYIRPITGAFDERAVVERLRGYWGHVERGAWHYLSDGDRDARAMLAHLGGARYSTGSVPAIVLRGGGVTLTLSDGPRPIENGNRHDFLRWLTSTWRCAGQCQDYGTWWPLGVTADHVVSPPIEHRPAWFHGDPADRRGEPPGALPKPPASPTPAEVHALARATARDDRMTRWLLDGATVDSSSGLEATPRLEAVFQRARVQWSGAAALFGSLLVLESACPFQLSAWDLQELDALPERLRDQQRVRALHVKASALREGWRSWLIGQPQLETLCLYETDAAPAWTRSLRASVCVHD